MERGEREVILGNGTLKWVSGVIATLLCAWIIWCSTVLISIDKRVAVIEGNRFTSNDATELLQALNQKADRNEVPPQWFIERVRILENRFDEHAQKLPHENP